LAEKGRVELRWVSARPMTHWRAWVVLAAAGLLIVAAGARGFLIDHLYTEVVIPLSGSRADAKSHGGNAYIVNLSRYRLSRYSDSSAHPNRSPFVLTEDSRPLQAHTDLAEIRAGLGKFIHWHDVLLFSSSDGSDPFANGKDYVFSGKIPKLRWLVVLPYLDSIALIALALLFVLQQRFIGTDERALSRIGLPVLAMALAVSYAFQLYPISGRFGITPDSESYTWNADNPVRPIRPPAYAAFMGVVSDARQVGIEVRALGSQGKANQILTDQGSEALRRVVSAQKVFLAAALVAAFLALSTFLPMVLAAGLTLSVGYFLGKSGAAWIVARPFWEISALLLLCIAALALIWRLTTLSRAAVIAAGVVITLYPVVRMLLYVRLVPDSVDFIMSETLTMAAQLLLVACLCCFLYTRKALWLYFAAVAFALSVWMRPAAIFEFGMIGLAVVAVCVLRPRPSVLAMAGGLVLSGMFVYAPGLYKRITLGAEVESNPMMSWSLACFALEVAQPEDVKLMPNQTAVRFFNDAFTERKRRLDQEVARASGPAFGRLGLNMYLVALPVAQNIAGGHALSPAVTDLLYEFAVPIYKARARELMRIWLESFRFGVTDGTRLSEVQPLWWTLTGLLVLVCLVRRPVVVAGCIVLLGHFGHVLIASVFDAPIARYVHATEFMVVIGLCLVIAGAVAELASLRPELLRVSSRPKFRSADSTQKTP
jgi:hypothetical protein